MSRKRRGEHHFDLYDQSAKRIRNNLIDVVEGNYFAVRFNHNGENLIFDDYERCKPYFNRKNVSVFAFGTLKDAENFTKLSTPVAGIGESSSLHKCTEGLNDKTSGGITEPPEIICGEESHEKQSEDQIWNLKTKQDITEWPAGMQLIALPDPVPKKTPNRISVHANGTTSITRGKDAKMGFGIYFKDGSPHNYAGSVQGSVSSQRADLKAALEAIKITVHRGIICPGTDIDLCVNSNYVKQGFESWMCKWKGNGWKNANNGPIKNLDLWKEVDSMLEFLKRERVHVRVSNASGSHGSFAAGRLAEKAMREG